MFKFGKDPEHLHHHLAGGVSGVKRFSGATKDDFVISKNLNHLGKLAYVTREPIDAEDDQGVKRMSLDIGKHLFQARPVHVGAGRGISENLMDGELVVLDFAVRLESVPLGIERILLMILVGADAGIKGDAHSILMLGVCAEFGQSQVRRTFAEVKRRCNGLEAFYQSKKPAFSTFGISRLNLQICFRSKAINRPFFRRNGRFMAFCFRFMAFFFRLWIFGLNPSERKTATH